MISREAEFPSAHSKKYGQIIIKHLIPKLGHFMLDKLRTEHIQSSYTRWLSEGSWHHGRPACHAQNVFFWITARTLEKMT